MMNDNVNHPKHYADTCSIECIESMVIAFGDEAVINFCMCNAYKYLWRYKNKNGTEDLEKAKWYVDKAKSLYGKVRVMPDKLIALSNLVKDKLEEMKNEEECV